MNVPSDETCRRLEAAGFPQTGRPLRHPHGQLWWYFVEGEESAIDNLPPNLMHWREVPEHCAAPDLAEMLRFIRRRGLHVCVAVADALRAVHHNPLDEATENYEGRLLWTLTPERLALALAEVLENERS